MHSICCGSITKICGISHLSNERNVCGNLIERNKPERIIYAQHVEREGKLSFEEVCNNDLEGIVAKRKLGIYKSNAIGWLKIKNPKYSQAEQRHEMMTKAK
jgi:ATP-dependent DNA ligase